jgi:hypothetical protein
MIPRMVIQKRKHKKTNIVFEMEKKVKVVAPSAKCNVVSPTK